MQPLILSLSLLLTPLASPPASMAQPTSDTPELTRSQEPNDITFKAGAASLGVAVGGLGLGMLSWWISEPFQPFGFKETGFFEEWTYAGGGDKAGHFIANYLGTLMMANLYSSMGINPKPALLLAAGFSLLMGNGVEIIDGFTVHQFEYGDSIMNILGVSAALLQETFPEIKKLLGFRFGYFPSPTFIEKGKGLNYIKVVNDYSGQVVFADLKLAGLLPKLGLAPGWGKFLLMGVNWGTSNYRPRIPNDPPERRNLGFHLGLSLPELMASITSGPRLERAGEILGYFALPFLNLNVSQDLNTGHWYISAGVGNRFEGALP